MKRSTVVIALAMAPIALSVCIGVAFGTPGSNAVSVYPARGSVGSATEPLVLGTPKAVTVTRTVRVKTKQGTVKVRVKVQVPGIQPHITCGATACDIVFQVLTIQPGGFTGWHTHPGPTLVAVAGGEGSMYRAAASGCTPTKYGVGAGFLPPSTEVHNMRNEGTTPLVLHAFYFLPAERDLSVIRRPAKYTRGRGKFVGTTFSNEGPDEALWEALDVFGTEWSACCLFLTALRLADPAQLARDVLATSRPD